MSVRETGKSLVDAMILVLDPQPPRLSQRALERLVGGRARRIADDPFEPEIGKEEDLG